MRFLTPLALFSTIALVAVNAGAAPPDQDADARVHVTAFQHAGPMNSLEFKGVRGDYALADGRELQILGDARRPYVKLGDRRPVALTRIADNQFAAADRSISMTFDPAHETVTVKDIGG
jgi:hypothetical protein